MATVSANWLSILGVLAAVLGTAGVGGLLKTWLDHKRDTRKQTDDVAMDLVKRLEARVEKLEGDLEKERAKCDADLQIHRHRINNQRTLIYSLLHLFEMPAARRKDALASIRKDLASMEQSEATEKALIAAAPLVGGGE